MVWIWIWQPRYRSRSRSRLNYVTSGFGVRPHRGLLPCGLQDPRDGNGVPGPERAGPSVVLSVAENVGRTFTLHFNTYPHATQVQLRASNKWIPSRSACTSACVYIAGGVLGDPGWRWSRSRSAHRPHGGGYFGYTIARLVRLFNRSVDLVIRGSVPWFGFSIWLGQLRLYSVATFESDLASQGCFSFWLGQLGRLGRTLLALM